MAELTHRQQFKVAFLTRCAEAGLDDDQVRLLAAYATAGAGGRTKQAGVLGTAGLVAAAVPILGLIGAMQVGRVVGQGMAAVQDKPVDVKAVQRQELADTYAAMAAQLHQRNLRNAALGGPRPYRPGGRRP